MQNCVGVRNAVAAWGVNENSAGGNVSVHDHSAEARPFLSLLRFSYNDGPAYFDEDL
jgi:hypothetical protein